MIDSPRFPPAGQSPRRPTKCKALKPGELDRHELCNLVYLISSFTQLMREGAAGPLTPRQAEYLGHVLDCADAIGRLLEESAPPGSRGPERIEGALP